MRNRQTSVMRYQSVFDTSATSMKSGNIPGWISLLSCSTIFPRKYSCWVLWMNLILFCDFFKSLVPVIGDSTNKQQPLLPDSGGLNILPVTEPFNCNQAVYSLLNFDMWRPNLLLMTTPFTYDQVRNIWVWVDRVWNGQVRKVPMRNVWVMN